MGAARIDKFYIFVLILFLAAAFLINNLMNSEMYQCVKLTPSQAQTIPHNLNHNNADSKDVMFHRRMHTKIFSTNVLKRDIKFNISDNDVIVFLHIQKTAGSIFGRHLAQNMQHKCNCSSTTLSRRCNCSRPGDQGGIWLFSKYSTGWSCGVHPTWTALNGCVPQVLNKKERKMRKRRYLYVTQLREPIARFLSEWRHVQRGATWPSKHLCNGLLPTDEELPSCYAGENWIGVTLDQFMDCRWNMASNRQTRMLADLSLVGCYNISKMSTEDRHWLMLESAKRNLRRLAYFGLTEFQAESQYLFESTFDVKFVESFEQAQETRASRLSITPKQLERISKLNSLDSELYEYAKELFMQRVEYLRGKAGNNDTR